MGHAVISDHAGLREFNSSISPTNRHRIDGPMSALGQRDICLVGGLFTTLRGTEVLGLMSGNLMTTFIRQSDKTATLYTQRTVNMDVINECRFYFDFMLPSELLFKRKSNFLQKFNSCSSIVYHFGFVKCVKCV